MLLVGIFCIVGFQIWETLFPYPLLDPTVWSNKSFTLIVLSVSFGYMSFITNEFWIALWLQDIKHFAPLHIAALLLPQALAGVIWSYLGQALISKISGTMIMAVGGFAYLAFPGFVHHGDRGRFSIHRVQCWSPDYPHFQLTDKPPVVCQ